LHDNHTLTAHYIHCWQHPVLSQSCPVNKLTTMRTVDIDWQTITLWWSNSVSLLTVHCVTSTPWCLPLSAHMLETCTVPVTVGHKGWIGVDCVISIDELFDCITVQYPLMTWPFSSVLW